MKAPTASPAYLTDQDFQPIFVECPKLIGIFALYHVRDRKRGRGIERMARNLILAAILLSAAVLPSRTTSEENEEREREGQSLNGRKQQSAAASAARAPYEYSPADDDWPHILKTGCVQRFGLW